MTDKLARELEQLLDEQPEPEPAYPEIPEYEQEYCYFCATHPGARPHRWTEPA